MALVTFFKICTFAKSTCHGCRFREFLFQKFPMDEEWRKCEEERQRLHELSTKVVKVIKCGKVTIDKKACKEYLNKFNK